VDRNRRGGGDRLWLRPRNAWAFRALAGAMLLTCGLLAGCDSRPKAPALTDSPVYQNEQEGFRFLVPDGWLQSAAATLPTGPLEGEVLLTQYRMRTAAQGASLEVLCFDEPPDKPGDLHQYHAEPSHGITQWASVEEPESLEIGGTAAQRFVYSGKLANRDMIKEVVAFRRGQRVYSFIGLFWKSDENAREELRRAVASILWNG
jgi:hypothetical protein